MNELFIRQSINIKAPAAKVWDLLVNPEKTKLYMFGCKVISDWKIGSRVLWKGEADGVIYVKGYLVRIVPEQLLQYTVFDPNGKIEDIPANYLTVTYELSFNNGVTTFIISQGDFSKVANGEERYKHTVTGGDFILQKINELAEK